jgi:hypothetical protein
MHYFFWILENVDCPSELKQQGYTTEMNCDKVPTSLCINGT